MTTPPYIPEPGSLPARVLDLFSRNVDEYFTSSDLALKFQAPANSMKARLEAPLHYGLLRFEKKSSEDKPAWCVGPKFAAWRAQQLTANPKPAVAPQPARRKVGPRLPLDPATLVVHRQLPIPPAGSGRGGSQYARIWESLRVNDCVELPDRAAASMASWCKNNQQQATVRRLSPTTKGVWKLPAPTTATKSGAKA